MNRLMPIILLVSDGEDEALLQITPISGICANGVANIRTYEALKEWLDRHHATVVAFDQPPFVTTIKVPRCPKFTTEASGTCGQCVISGSDCDHCGPPAWEGFVGTADAEGGKA